MVEPVARIHLDGKDVAAILGEVTKHVEREIKAHREAIEAPLRELLRDFVDSCEGPAFDDLRLRWVEVQVDRDLIHRAREALGMPPCACDACAPKEKPRP